MKKQYKELYNLLTTLDHIEFEIGCYKHMVVENNYDHSENISNLKKAANKIIQEIEKIIGEH